VLKHYRNFRSKIQKINPLVNLPPQFRVLVAGMIAVLVVFINKKALYEAVELKSRHLDIELSISFV